jgi:hypothetical protein
MRYIPETPKGSDAVGASEKPGTTAVEKGTSKGK